MHDEPLQRVIQPHQQRALGLAFGETLARRAGRLGARLYPRAGGELLRLPDQAHISGLRYRGMAYSALDRTADSVSHFERAASVDPNGNFGRLAQSEAQAILR